MRCYLLFISTVLFISAFLMLQKTERMKKDHLNFQILDYPISFFGDLKIENNVANGRFDFNIIDIFAGFKGDKSLYLDLKEQIEKAPQPEILFQSLPLPKEGYFNLRGVLIIGEKKHIVHGVGFRNPGSLEMKFPVTLEEIGIEITADYADSVPRRVNIIGYINVD